MDIHGVAIIIPIIPKKCPKINNDITIVTGCKSSFFPITIGCKKLLSSACATMINIKTNKPVTGLWLNPTSIAGTPPM